MFPNQCKHCEYQLLYGPFLYSNCLALGSYLFTPADFDFISLHQHLETFTQLPEEENESLGHMLLGGMCNGSALHCFEVFFTSYKCSNYLSILFTPLFQPYDEYGPGVLIFASAHLLRNPSRLNRVSHVPNLYQSAL